MKTQTLLNSIFCTAFIALLLSVVPCDAANPKGSFTDARDKKTYKTVKIGEQVWMAENLNYNADSSKCYENQESNCQKYGRLYDWETAMKACPQGWHLPSDAEWQTLVDLADGDKVAGKVLKASSGWTKPDGWNINSNGTDEFGFSALPGGYGYSDGIFRYVGNFGHWWSSSATEHTEYNIIGAYYRSMDFLNKNVNRDILRNSYLFSVRCLQN